MCLKNNTDRRLLDLAERVGKFKVDTQKIKHKHEEGEVSRLLSPAETKGLYRERNCNP